MLVNKQRVAKIPINMGPVCHKIIKDTMRRIMSCIFEHLPIKTRITHMKWCSSLYLSTLFRAIESCCLVIPSSTDKFECFIGIIKEK